MPMIDLTVPKGVLTPERTDHLIKELSRIIIHWEGAEYSPLYRYATRMYIHEVEGVAVASKLHDPSKRPYYRVVVSVPQGTLNQERKRGVIKDVTEAVLRSEGGEPNARHLERVWCTINDVPDGDWGSGGQPRGVSANLSSSSNSTRTATAPASSGRAARRRPRSLCDPDSTADGRRPTADGRRGRRLTGCT